MHEESHPLAGKTVTIKTGEYEGKSYWIEDWQDRVFGKSWMVCNGNPAAFQYAVRSSFAGLPTDDDVVYGKIGALGHIVHSTELGDEVEAAS